MYYFFLFLFFSPCRMLNLKMPRPSLKQQRLWMTYPLASPLMMQSFQSLKLPRMVLCFLRRYTYSPLCNILLNFRGLLDFCLLLVFIEAILYPFTKSCFWFWGLLENVSSLNVQKHREVKFSWYVPFKRSYLDYIIFQVLCAAMVRRSCCI